MGETFFSSASKVSSLEKFTRGYRIEGSGEWFSLPETRLRIHTVSLFNEGRLHSEVDRNFVNPRVKMTPLTMKVAGEDLTAYVGNLTTLGDLDTFGGISVEHPKFEKNAKKKPSTEKMGGKRDGSKNSSTPKSEKNETR